MDSRILGSPSGIDRLGKFCAVLSGSENCYDISSRIVLGSQCNYVCLQVLQNVNTQNEINHEVLSVIRQRKEAWFLEPHHLLTNSCVKCCNTGIPER